LLNLQQEDCLQLYVVTTAFSAFVIHYSLNLLAFRAYFYG